MPTTSCSSSYTNCTCVCPSSRISSILTSLSALLGNLLEHRTQEKFVPSIRHISTSCGDIWRGPQSDPNDTHDVHYADVDNEAYAAHGGCDDFDNSTYVDLLTIEIDYQKKQLQI